jgi:hypothetical protein
VVRNAIYELFQLVLVKEEERVILHIELKRVGHWTLRPADSSSQHILNRHANVALNPFPKSGTIKAAHLGGLSLLRLGREQPEVDFT